MAKVHHSDLYPLEKLETPTLRDIFAMRAMNGICTLTSDLSPYTVNGGWIHPDSVAKASYEIADAMLKERTNTKNPF